MPSSQIYCPHLKAQLKRVGCQKEFLMISVGFLWKESFQRVIRPCHAFNAPCSFSPWPLFHSIVRQNILYQTRVKFSFEADLVSPGMCCSGVHTASVVRRACYCPHAIMALVFVARGKGCKYHDLLSQCSNRFHRDAHIKIRSVVWAFNWVLCNAMFLIRVHRSRDDALRQRLITRDMRLLISFWRTVNNWSHCM